MLLALPYEVWRDVKDYEGLYQVSNMGNVKSLDRVVIYNTGQRHIHKSKPIIPSVVKGYLRISLSKQNVIKNIFIHRLVADAFIPNPDNKPQVDHINTDTTDNRIENLRWVTSKENNLNDITRQHKSEAFKGEKCYWHHKKGKIHPSSKSILQYDLEGNFIKEWNSINAIERDLGICRSTVSNCCLGKSHHKTAGGYVWEYKVIQT